MRVFNTLAGKPRGCPGSLGATAIALHLAVLVGFGLGDVTSWAFDQTRSEELNRIGTSADPRRVSLASLAACNVEGRVLVRWETAMEIGVVGFDVYREVQGEWVKVNEGLVPAAGAGVGGRYELLDHQATAPGPHRYRLTLTLNTGKRMELNTSALEATEVVDPAGVAPRRSQPRVGPLPVDVPDSQRNVRLAGGPSVPIPIPGTTTSVKITTGVAGMHFLGTTNLANLLGYSNAAVATVQGWIDNSQIALWNKGQQIAFVPGNGRVALNRLGPGIYFYAETNLNNYTATNVYWLKSGANTFGSVDGQNPTPVEPGPYTAVSFAEFDEEPGLAVVQDPEDDFWFWRSLTAGSPPADELSTTISVDRLVRSAGTTATLKLRFYGGSLTDHKVEVTLNGTLLGTHEWSGLTPTTVQFTFDATTSARLKDSSSGEGSNSLLIKAVLKPGVSVSTVWVDKYRLDYRRRYFVSTVANLEGEAGGNAVVTTTNFTSTAALASTILGFDVTDVKQIKRITGITVAGSGTTRTASFVPASGSARFAILQPVVNSAAQTVDPTKMAVVYPPNLSDPANKASYVAIAPAALLASAQSLANYRSADFRTKVVLLDDIYNEFSYGLVTPHAIESFLQTAYSQWAIPPRYLALVGDGTWDYRNKYSFADNLVPPLMVLTPYGLFTSDLLFGNVLGEGLPRVLVGRLPVKTTADFNIAFAKIQSYEAESVAAPLKALLVAGQPDEAGDFIENIEAVEGYLSPAYTSQLIHPDRAPATVDYSALKAQIQTAINGGVEVVNYVGHGAVDLFGTGLTTYFVKVFQPQTLDPTLSNGSRLPIVVAMTCVAGQYSSPGFTSLGESLIRQSGAGAVAVIAPTGLSQDDEAAWINRRFMELLGCNTTGRLGDIFAQSAALYNVGYTRLTPVWIYNVIGDPALEIKAP